MEKANIVPIHKKSAKQIIENYRPISLLPIFGKLLGKLIFQSLCNHLEEHSLLFNRQSGSRPGDSTVNQLPAITHEIYSAFYCNPSLDVRSDYLDISEAFDLVYIDDLPEGLKKNSRIFADDTSVFSVVIDPHSSANDLNHDLHLRKDWAFQWKITFDPHPNKQAEQLIFSRKRSAQIHPPIHFQDTLVTTVNKHKHLGLIRDRRLSFSIHIKDVLRP